MQDFYFIIDHLASCLLERRRQSQSCRKQIISTVPGRNPEEPKRSHSYSRWRILCCKKNSQLASHQPTSQPWCVPYQVQYILLPPVLSFPFLFCFYLSLFLRRCWEDDEREQAADWLTDRAKKPKEEARCVGWLGEWFYWDTTNHHLQLARLFPTHNNTPPNRPIL